MSKRNQSVKAFLESINYDQLESLRTELDMFGKHNPPEIKVGQVWLASPIKGKNATAAVFVISHVAGSVLRGFLVIIGKNNLVLATKADEVIPFMQSPITDCFVCTWRWAALTREHLREYYGSVDEETFNAILEKAHRVLFECTVPPVYNRPEMRRLRHKLLEVTSVFDDEVYAIHVS